ncbi:hypothetical protein DBB29_24685 [Pandoraea cepalis]|uniref:Uncharacterized protein n=1 Tax=Pandoraea cepalis TaxID=2508294 RepID=A0AAW7MGI5_9BURK|nr:hypothetical protein [Pandoraea cepalis]MDN4571858.1 hypothetical protein [Pandoraea cepalis]MDN4581312.1 hypothetical protein [Pandoraea cepalis]
MKVRSFLEILATRGPNTPIHAIAIALIATGLFMLVTASGMGPVAPIFLAASFYMFFAAVATELALATFACIRWIARTTLRRVAP